MCHTLHFCPYANPNPSVQPINLKGEKRNNAGLKVKTFDPYIIKMYLKNL